MKALITAVVVVGVMVTVLQIKSNSEPIVFVNEKTMEVVEELEVIEEDTIEKARQELERINAELDAKETELLQERDAIDAELERLRETRVSFQ